MNPLLLKTALISSYHKDRYLLRISKLLQSLNWRLLGSAGTARFLGENNIDCVDIASIVGRPILGHRVVTLSRELHAGLLAKTPRDFEELDQLNIRPIGLVYVTLYPLLEIIINPKVTDDDVMENTDVGGIALLHAAAKGLRVVVSDAKQIKKIAPWLKNGYVDKNLLVSLVAAAERRVADYVSLSASYWESRAGQT